jgi:hypothetical protein
MSVNVEFRNFTYDRNASPNTKISCTLTIDGKTYIIKNGQIGNDVGSLPIGTGSTSLPTKEMETNVINAIIKALNLENSNKVVNPQDQIHSA